MFGTKGRLKRIDGTISQPEAIGVRYVLIPVATDGKTDNSLLRKWPSVQKEYRAWYSEGFGTMQRFLGKVKQVLVQSDLIAVPMLCIHNEKLDVKALKLCIADICKDAKLHYGSIHMIEIEEALPFINDALEGGTNVNLYQK